MTQILLKDQADLEDLYPDAARHLRAAELRAECHSLAFRGETRTEWMTNRLKELLRNAPACKEPWFVEKLEKAGYLRVEVLLGT